VSSIKKYVENDCYEMIYVAINGYDLRSKINYS